MYPNGIIICSYIDEYGRRCEKLVDDPYNKIGIPHPMCNDHQKICDKMIYTYKKISDEIWEFNTMDLSRLDTSTIYKLIEQSEECINLRIRAGRECFGNFDAGHLGAINRANELRLLCIDELNRRFPPAKTITKQKRRRQRGGRSRARVKK